MLKPFLDNLKSPKGRDYIFTFLGQAAVVLCMLVTNKLISYNTTVENFGIYNLVRRNSAVLCFIMLGGTGITLPRYLSMYAKQNLFFTAKDYLRSIFAYLFISSALTLVAVLILYPWMGELLVGSKDFTFYLILIAYSFSTALGSFVFAYYRGLENFIVYNVGQIFIHLLLVLPLFIFEYISISQLFLIWALLYFISAISVYFYETHKYHGIFYHKSSKTKFVSCFKDITTYSIPRLAGDSFLFLISAFPLLYISQKLSMTSVSHFSVGLSMLTMATPLFSVLGVILLPYVSSSLVQGKMEEASRFIKKLSLIYLVVAIFITVSFIIFMPILISLFFADKYLVALPLAQILMLSLLPESMYLLYRNPIDAVAKTPYNTYIMFISLMALIIAFVMCESLISFAWAYFFVATLRGLSSYLIWQKIRMKTNYKLR